MLPRPSLELDDKISTLQGDIRAASKVRNVEHPDFMTAHADYQSPVDALVSGIETTKTRDHEVMQADHR